MSTMFENMPKMSHLNFRTKNMNITRKTSPSATMRGLPAAPPAARFARHTPPPLATLATPPHAARFARPLHCKTTSIGLGTSYKAAYKCVMQYGLNWPLSSVQDNQWLLPVTL